MLVLAALASAQPVVVSAEVESLYAGIDALTPETCAATLEGAFAHVRAMDPSQADLEDVAANGELSLTRLFAARRLLQVRLGEAYADGALTPECVTGARRFDLATRYVADHLVMAGVTEEAWLMTPGFSGPEDLQAGDLLVTRGAGLSSSGIAHIGRIDTQFSHNALVHRDADGRLWTVEAYLEHGAVVQPLEAFLAHGLGRIVVLRFEDPALAARGAALAYDRIATGPAIDYDEAFDTDHPDELFCSEVGPWALRLAGGPDDVPLTRTELPRDVNPALFDGLGIGTDRFAAPADVLVDPRFALVGEWRDHAVLEDMRRQDAVVDSVYRWMEEDGATLVPSWSQRATVDVGLAVRRTPGVGAVVADRIHPHGERGFLVTGLALQATGEVVYATLQERLAEREGVVPWDDLQAEIEAIRVEDRARYDQRVGSARFHKVLQPAR